jgi:hypothetical protein
MQLASNGEEVIAIDRTTARLVLVVAALSHAAVMLAVAAATFLR